MKTEAMEAEVTVARETLAAPRKATEAEVMEISEEEITRIISRLKEGENRHPIHNRDMNLSRKEK